MPIRLLPDSLFGRFLVVLVVSCAFAQLIGAALILQIGPGLPRREITIAEEVGSRMAGILAPFESLSAAQRLTVLQGLGERTIDIDVARWPFPPNARAVSHQALLRGIGERIRARLGADADLEVQFVQPPPDESSLRSHRVGPSDHSAPPTSLLVSARRAGEPALNFRVNLPRAEPSAPSRRSVIGYRLAGQFLALLAGVTLGAYIAARRINEPLSRLAWAADSLGRSLNQPPLPKTGPRELRQVAQGFNVMQDRLRRHIGSRTRVVAAMSHDLRTPLTRMRLRAEVLEDPVQREKFTRDVVEMETMVLATLDALCDLGIEEPQQSIDVNELLATLRVEFADLGRAVIVHGSAAGPYLGRPQALKRCLSNLIDNAIKFGKQAVVSVTDGRSLRIVVADQGPGIPENELERVFEPFYRVESSRSRGTGGTGLGLCVARDSAQAHGGQLVLRNREEGGLEAELLLPRAA